MKFYESTTEYNCGIDLHSRQMYMCVMDRQGHKLVHSNITGNDFGYFLERVKPYRDDLTVVCECTFNWPWLADACADAGISFVLGHALYLRAIHGGKNKNDRIDSEKLAHLLRSNLIPPAYVYPVDLALADVECRLKRNIHPFHQPVLQLSREGHLKCAFGLAVGQHLQFPNGLVDWPNCQLPRGGTVLQHDRNPAMVRIPCFDLATDDAVLGHFRVCGVAIHLVRELLLDISHAKFPGDDEGSAEKVGK